MPLSYAQERLWFVDRLYAGSPHYNIPLGLRLRGELDSGALERALREIVQRHESLRTRFPMRGPAPAQAISPDADLPFEVADLSDLPAAQRDARLPVLAAGLGRYRFDLERGPLLRATLFRVAPQDHLLVVVMHHIISDGWSVAVLFRELATLYTAFRLGEPSPLPPLATQYADYTLWQRERLQGALPERELRYWRAQLSDLPVLDLPTDRPRPPAQGWEGVRVERPLPVPLREALYRLARAERATPFMLLLAAFCTLLYRYTHQTDLVVGTPIANRLERGTESLIGFFVNMLALRAQAGADDTFRGLLSRVRETCIDAFAHQELPFEKLVADLAPPRDPARHPLFQTFFAFQDRATAVPDLPGLEAEFTRFGNGTAKLDLGMYLRERRDGIVTSIEYSSDLFRPETIERMLDHWQTLLEGIVADPECALARLPLLAPAERYRIIAEWSGCARDYPWERCVHELFAAQAARTPAAPAVAHGDTVLEYAELDARANRLAHRLRALGAGPGAPVAVCLEPGIAPIVAMLAVLKAGAVYVSLDPRQPPARQAAILADCGAGLVIAGARHRDAQRRAGPLLLDLDAQARALAAQPATAPAHATRAGEAACILYTSGSTGTPKGVVIPHRGIARLVCNTNYLQLDASERVAQAANLAFDAATFEVWGALLNGACLVVIEREVLLDPPALARRLRAARVTTLFVTTALFNLIARGHPGTFAGLRCVAFGGETADPTAVRQVLENDRPARLLHMYGPTENATFTTWYEVNAVAADARSVPIGRPIANTRVYLLDAQRQPVPVGVAGELCIAGDGLALGYHARPDLTAEQFVEDPFADEPGARMYRSGDLARWLPDGNIEFLGRTDRQVKIRGHRVEPAELEAALAAHAAVDAAHAVARACERGEWQLVGYVVPRPGALSPAGTLREFLAARLPDYLLPAHIVTLDALPLTPNGKVDEAALPAPAPATALEQLPARNVRELGVQRLWQKLLGGPAPGVNDSFFDLGGHSLLTVQLLAEIRRMYGREISLADFFREPTIAAVARRLAMPAGDAPATPLVPIQPDGARPPLFLAPGGGGGEFELMFIYAALVRKLGGDQPVYGLSLRDAGSGAARSVEALAADFVRAARALQPHGPYHLAGECVGGAIAFEMACLLERAGETVALLALLDSRRPRPGARWRLAWAHWRGRTRAWFRNLRYFAARAAHHLAALSRSAPSSWPRQLRDKAHSAALLGVGLVAADRIKRERVRHARTVVRYRPGQFRGRLTLIVPETGAGDPARGWQPHALGGIDVRRVPGDHKSYVRDHVDSTAACLKDALDAAQGARAPA